MPKLNSFQRVSVGLTTISNVEKVAATFDTTPFSDDAAFLVTVKITARSVDDAAKVSGTITSALFYKSAGVLTLAGAAVDQFSEGQAWAVAVEAVTTNITVSVTGIAEEIKWLVEADIQINDDAPIFIAAPADP